MGKMYFMTLSYTDKYSGPSSGSSTLWLNRRPGSIACCCSSLSLILALSWLSLILSSCSLSQTEQMPTSHGSLHLFAQGCLQCRSLEQELDLHTTWLTDMWHFLDRSWPQTPLSYTIALQMMSDSWVWHNFVTLCPQACKTVITLLVHFILEMSL